MYYSLHIYWIQSAELKSDFTIVFGIQLKRAVKWTDKHLCPTKYIC